MRHAQAAGTPHRNAAPRGHGDQLPRIEFAMTVSIGISALNDQDMPTTLFARADQALYNAKRNGRNQVCAAQAAVPVQ